MSSDDPLSHILKLYHTVRDCSVVTKRALKEESLSAETIDSLFGGTDLFSGSEEEVFAQVDESMYSFDDLIILTLYATFERHLIECFQEKGEAIQHNKPEWLAENLFTLYKEGLERNRLIDILEWFNKAKIIKDTVIGNVKKINKYRNWIAHRNPKYKQDEKFDPIMVYETLFLVIYSIHSVLYNQYDIKEST